MTPASRLPVEAGDYVLNLCRAGEGHGTGSEAEGTRILLANDISNSHCQGGKIWNWQDFRIFTLPAKTGKAYQAVSGIFHKILIDAPCSGKACFIKSLKWQNTGRKNRPLTILRFRKLLEQGAQIFARPGGILLYSTTAHFPKRKMRK